MAAFVQKTAEFFLTGVTGGSRSITGVTAGNTVVCMISLGSQPNTSPVPAINTPTGASWNVGLAPTGATGSDPYRGNTAVFFLRGNQTGAGGTFTATWATGQLPTDTYAAVSLIEISGLDSTSPLDVTASAVSASQASPAPSGTTAASSALGGIVFVSGMPGGNPTLLQAPPSTGYTNIDNEPDPSTNNPYSFAYKLLSGSAAQSATWTYSGGPLPFVGLAVAFKNAAGAGGSTMTAAAGTSTTSTMAGRSGAASAMTGAAGTSTTSSMAGRSTAASALTAAPGTSTTSTMAGRAAATAAMSAAAGSSTTSTMVGSSAAGASADMTPAAGTSTTSTLGTASTAASALTPAAGTSTTSALAGRSTATTAMTAASGTSVTSTMVGSSAAAGTATMTPATGTSTTGTLGTASAASTAMVPAAGTSTTGTLTTSGGQPQQPTSGGGGIDPDEPREDRADAPRRSGRQPLPERAQGFYRVAGQRKPAPVEVPGEIYPAETTAIVAKGDTNASIAPTERAGGMDALALQIGEALALQMTPVQAAEIRRKADEQEALVLLLLA